jgi:hypothetical protein
MQKSVQVLSVLDPPNPPYQGGQSGLVVNG